MKLRLGEIQIQDLLADVIQGHIQLPGKEWKPYQKLKKERLFRSLRKNYPIGSFTLWKPKDNVKTMSSLGGITIENDKEPRLYLIDGYKRLDTLFCLLGDQWLYSLSLDSIRDKTDMWDLNESCYPLRDIYEIDLLFKIYKSTPGGEKDIEKLTDLHDRFHRYAIPTIEVVGGTWDDIREIQALS